MGTNDGQQKKKKYYNSSCTHERKYSLECEIITSKVKSQNQKKLNVYLSWSDTMTTY
jgi:hypothetical protein